MMLPTGATVRKRKHVRASLRAARRGTAKKRFIDLVSRLRAETSATKRERIKEELAREVFGSAQPRMPAPRVGKRQ
jgi:hypothetical protein